VNKLFNIIGKEFGLGILYYLIIYIIDILIFRYVAYGTTGDIDDALKQLFQEQKQKTPRDEFIQLIKRKAPLAQKMHGSRRIGPHQNLLNEMFASGDAEKLCDELQNSDMIVKGDPGKSKLLNHAVSFHGPMYQVFYS
jgi:hypothetical protein